MTDPARTYRVGLGVCGGIAAYKAVELLRLLQKAGCRVSVAMTRHATEFVRPLTFRALTGEYVIVDDYDPENPDPIAHVSFSQNVDLLLIAPATANIIAKFAAGIADDFLTSTYLASTAPVMVAPAMNVSMWEHPATRRNVERLAADGVRFVAPVAGELACRTVGTGKLEDVENIAAQALEQLGSLPASGAERGAAKSGLAGERVLITVGGTREAIDPVRFISNHSSGKMGFALAEAARDRGADVTVVCGVTAVGPPAGVAVVRAVSAEEMYRAVMDRVADTTVFVGAAAVADYRPRTVAPEKIKKTDQPAMTIELERTPDILAAVSEHRHDDLLVVGFAAETNDVVGYARAKLERKNLDMIVANDVSRSDIAFGSDDNAVTIVTRDSATEIDKAPKRVIADGVWDAVAALRRG